MRSLNQVEHGFQDSVIALAVLHGWEWFHDEDSRRNRAGLSDLILSRGPRLVTAELKVDWIRKTGKRAGKKEYSKTTDKQREWLARFKAKGIEAVVWRPTPCPSEKWPFVETSEAMQSRLLLNMRQVRQFEMGMIERRLFRPPDVDLDAFDAQIAAFHLPSLVKFALLGGPS